MGKKPVLKTVELTEDDPVRIEGVPIQRASHVITGGLVKLWDTHGIPFSVSFGILKSRGLIPAWVELFDEAKQIGWRRDTFMSRLEEGLVDVFGREFKEFVLEVLELVRPAEG